MAYEYSRNFANYYQSSVFDVGSQSSFSIDSAFVFETSGDVAFATFISPISQTSGALTLSFYVDGITGSPTLNGEVRNGAGASDDPDRPESGGSTLGTPGSDVSPTVADTWYQLTWTSLTLVKGQQYYFIIKNTHGTPASNYADVVYRAQLDGSPTILLGNFLLRAGATTNGFSADPTIVGSSVSPIIVTFDDGSSHGNPYVEAGVAASGTDWRGLRINFDEDVVCSGCMWTGTTSATLAGTFAIYQGSTLIASSTGNRWISQRVPLSRWSPVTLTGGVDYDIIVSGSLSSSFGTQFDTGQNTIPAEVAACQYHNSTYVTGATPGSLTETATQLWAISPIIDQQPAIAGGGGASGVRNPFKGPIG